MGKSKFRNTLNSKSIRYKLIFGYVVSMISVVIVVLGMYFFINKEVTGNELFKNDYSQISLFTNFIEEKLEAIGIVSDSIITSENIKNKLATDGEYNQEYEEEIKRALYLNEGIKSIYIINRNKEIDAYNDRSYYNTYPKELIKSIDFNKLDKLRGKLSYDIKLDAYTEGERGREEICLSRAIISNETFEVIGYSVIFIDNKYIYEIYEECLAYTKGEYIIRDKNNNIISLPSKGKCEEASNLIFGVKRNDTEYNKIIYNNTDYNVVLKNMDIIGGEIALIKEPIKYKEEIISIVLIVLIINIIFATIYFNVIDFLILEPIANIISWIEKIIYGVDLENPYFIKNNEDEIGKINVALNGMLGKVNGLVDRIKEEHMLQRKLELDLISNQVKPHFLFNILNVARALISLEKYDLAKNLLNVTAKYYRVSLSKGKDVILLEEELSILKNYIAIMQIKSEDEVSVEYMVDDEALKIMVPKLILQPIVENIFKHAVKGFDTKLKILIKVKLISKDYAEVEIIDNGRGIDINTINMIYSENELERESGFGMKSVIKRMSLYYGDDNPRNLVKINSEIDVYTKVILRLDNSKLKLFN